MPVFYAYWKSCNSPSAQGRISIPVSLVESPTTCSGMDEKIQSEKPPKPRGWWDYVPNPQLSPRTQLRGKPNEPIHRAVQSKLNAWVRRNNKKKTVSLTRLDQPRSSVTSDSGQLLARHSIPQSAHYVVRPTSPTPSSFSRISKLIPNMVLFRKVMTDEVGFPALLIGHLVLISKYLKLLYTGFITANCVAVAVLVIIGVNFKNSLTITGWVGVNCALILLLPRLIITQIRLQGASFPCLQYIASAELSTDMNAKLFYNVARIHAVILEALEGSQEHEPRLPRYYFDEIRIGLTIWKIRSRTITDYRIRGALGIQVLQHLFRSRLLKNNSL
jgi:hypothetical protein